MSKIFELKTKYQNYDVSTLNHTQKTILSDELKAFKPEDLGSIEEHRAYLELLKFFRKSLVIDGVLNGRNFPELLKNLLSVDVYSSPLRFLFELIQNVDDCDYADPSCVELDIKTDFNNGKIILTYNEVGFKPFDVFSITGIAEASKNVSADKVEIGEKGIGFKSAFGVADKVLIQSGKFSFELYKNNFTIPEPQYDEYEEIKGTRLTLYVEPAMARQIYQMFTAKYRDREAILNQNPVLFLNKLTKLRVYFDNLRTITFAVERSAQKTTSGLQVETDVHLTVDFYDCHGRYDTATHQELICTRYTKPIVYNREMCISRYGENTTFPNKPLYMHIVFPHPEYIYGDKAIKTGAFYSFLPTLIKLAIPMACHVPFKLDPPREYIDPQKKNAWFNHSCNEFAEMLKEVYVDYSRRVKEHIISYLPFKNCYLFQATTEKIDFLKQDAFKGETIMSWPIFYTVDNHFLPVEKVFMYQSSIEIADPIGVYKLLEEPRELFLPDERAKIRNPGISIISNVYELLFSRAMLNRNNTEAILQLLSNVDSFSFVKAVSEIREKIFDTELLRIIAKYPKCLRAFQDGFIAQLVQRRPLFYKASVNASEVHDVRYIEGGESGLDNSDFKSNAKAYFSSIKYGCYYLSGTPESFFFACNNVLFLSDEHRTVALSDFCERLDSNCTLALALRFKNASNQLNSISSDMDATEYLQLLRTIRKAIKSAMGEEAYSRYIHLINEAGIDSERYINELLQNADDCKYSDDVEPTFKLVISEEDATKIKTSYNELGFTHQHVRAITSIGESTKKRLLSDDGKIEIGEKGIGFKSVFAVAKGVRIRSGNYDFGLTYKEPTVPVLPQGDIKFCQGTRMYFDLKEPMRKDFFTEAKVLKLCLCLHTLKHIKLGEFDVRIFDDGTIRRIKINNKSYEYQIITHQFKLPNYLILSEQVNHQREIKCDQKVICYVPTSKEAKNCYLYVGLPTRVKINVPLIIDAPFALTTSRDHLLDNQWNEYVRTEVYTAIQHTIESLAESEGISVLRFLHVKREGTEFVADIFTDDMLNDYDFLKNLRKLVFLQTYQVGRLVAPSDVRARRIPDVLSYCLENHYDIGILPRETLKIKENSKYEGQAGALRLQFLDVHTVLSSLSKVCDNIIANDAFRTLFYTYLADNMQALRVERHILRMMEIIPVYGSTTEGDIEYRSWNEIGEMLFVKPNCKVSTSTGFILALHLMDKKLCENLFGVNVNELTIQTEKAIYREKLNELLGTLSDEELYLHLLREFKNNRKMLDSCVDVLRARCSVIPLKNELGAIRRGKIYVSNESSGYFFGSIFPQHIAHSECREFAIYIGCKYITEIYYDDLTITDDLTEDDINLLEVEESLKHRFEIIACCVRDGWIPNTLDERVSIYRDEQIDYDKSVLNQPVNRLAFEKHMRTLLANRIRIEKRWVERPVSFCVPENGGKEYLYDSDEARNAALHRYETGPKSGYCVCQMCQNAIEIKYMEVNSILVTAKYHWTGCGVSLCKMCSVRFKEFRGNVNVRKSFYREIKRANVYVDCPITLNFGTSEIIFGQKHLAEIQEILKAEE